jgi:hypothetical protein
MLTDDKQLVRIHTEELQAAAEMERLARRARDAASPSPRWSLISRLWTAEQGVGGRRGLIQIAR